MEIGDRVRLLHGKEEGIIRRFIDQKMVEVEIEEGFLIPVLKSELVTIDRGESESFKQEERSSARQEPQKMEFLPEEQKDIYLALEIRNANIELWLINHTDHTVLFTAHAKTKDQTRGLSYGTLRKFTYSKIDSWNLRDQDQWPLLAMAILPFIEKGKEPGKIISKNLTIKNSLLIRKKVKAPLLNVDATLIRLTEDHNPVDPERIKMAFFDEKEPAKDRKDSSPAGREIMVDLHIESLDMDFSGLGSEEILKIQVDHFEKELEKALVNNLSAVTFIHGIGNGILRNKIHKFLSQYPHIKYFEDARKEKFGFGATKVILK
ncbi:MAG: Smr/MutS family protein [Cyclobacteriaceae bacterium]|nr:Smr/MutS family protein [Cyclobacteriaceae bacterium]